MSNPIDIAAAEIIVSGEMRKLVAALRAAADGFERGDFDAAVAAFNETHRSLATIGRLVGVDLEPADQPS